MNTSKNKLNTIITDEVQKLSESFEYSEKTTDDILQELSKSINKIDFQILAFPDIEIIKNKLKN